MKIAAIIVTFNRKKLLLEAIEALLNQTNTNFDIFIIDNASSDGTNEALNSYIINNQIIYFNTGNNLGGAGGFHFGIKKVMEKNYDYIWMMDDDSIVNKDCLEKLIDAKNKLKDDFSFLSSYVYWEDGEPCVMNFQRGLEYDWIKNNDCLIEGIIPIKTCTFVSIFINTKIIKLAGLPIKEFFIWSDDTEYTYRLSQIKPAYYVAKSKVLHKIAFNQGSDIISCDKSRIDRYSIAVRNRFFIAKKYGFKSLITFHSQFIKSIIKLSTSKTKCKSKRLKALFKGYFKGIFFNPKIEKIG
jgi:GT2 family glycosyltransferase